MLGVLLFLLGLSVFLTLFRLLIVWASRYMTRWVESRCQAAEVIVDQGRVPEAWALPLRRRIEAMRRRGRSARAVERAGRRAQARLVRELDALTRYLEQGARFDSEDTRRHVLQSLRERRRDWVAGSWQSLLECETEPHP